MPDDSVLAGHDPYDLMDTEAARLDAWFGGLEGDAWDQSTACEGWDVQDVLAHLAFGEEYNAACLDDAIPTFLERYTSRGAADINGFNVLGVTDRAERSPDELLAEWRAACARTRTELRALDGGDLTTGAGPYPARWQAWHLASELATHADDIGVPESPDEAAGRQAWRAAFAHFALDEMRPEVAVEAAPDGGTLVRAGGAEAVLDDAELTAVVNGRLPADHPLDPEPRAGAQRPRMTDYAAATYGDRIVEVYDELYGFPEETDAAVELLADLAGGGAGAEGRDRHRPTGPPAVAPGPSGGGHRRVGSHDGQAQGEAGRRRYCADRGRLRGRRRRGTLPARRRGLQHVLLPADRRGPAALHDQRRRPPLSPAADS